MAARKRTRKQGPARPRRPGRPRQQDAADVRERLIDAAVALARARGFDAISTREIAREAGVTPGMIAYYFAGKQGLFEAMLGRTYDQLVAHMREFLAAPTAPGAAPIARLVELQLGTVAATPWLPPLLAREVLARESPLRSFVVERIAQGPAKLVPELLRREMQAGRIRDDLDPELLMLSIVGMGMFPYLMHPVVGEVLGYRLDDAFRDRMIAHVQALLARGLAPEGAR